MLALWVIFLSGIALGLIIGLVWGSLIQMMYDIDKNEDQP